MKNKKQYVKNKNYGYLAKEGVRGVFLHGFMSFAAICVTVACLIIIGSFSLIMLNLDHMVTELDQQNQVLVYVDDTYTTAEAHSIGSQINLLENVRNQQFVTKEEALQTFVAEQKDPSMFAGLQADTLRHRFVVTLESSEEMQDTVEKLQALEGVAEVNAHLEVAEGFSTVRDVLQFVSTAIIVVLLVVSLFIIANTVKLALYDRKDEIGIMKMVGATNSFIRVPFIIEGSIIGLFSAAVAFFAEWGIYDLLTNKIAAMDTLQLFTAIPFHHVLGTMVLAFVGAGLFVGVFGSLMSIRKFLNV